MATVPCFESTSCIELTTKGNALIANPILAGTPPSAQWPYDCDVGEFNGLRCGVNGMWSSPPFFTDWGSSKSADAGWKNIGDQVGQEKTVGNTLKFAENAEQAIKNNSCYNGVAVVNCFWGYMEYQSSPGRSFYTRCIANSDRMPAADYAFQTYTDIRVFTPVPGPSDATCFAGGQKTYLFELDAGASMGFEMYFEAEVDVKQDSSTWVPDWGTKEWTDQTQDPPVVNSPLTNTAWGRGLSIKRGNLQLNWFVVPMET